jgi:zinc transport system ATP-binding protein
MTLIQCEQISLSYDNNTILSNLSLTVEAGDCLCIVGENGTGKSTLIKALLGLKAPSSGRISYGSGLKANNIGYLPQKTEAQKDFPASVWEVILSGRLNRHRFLSFYNKADKQFARSQMKRLGIEHLANRSFADLSGGQQQRVLLGRALCSADDLLLLDEPVAGLDPVATAELYATIEQLNRDGMTVIMVSHDLLSSLKYATKVLWLQNDGYEILTAEAFAEKLPTFLYGGLTK